jgi:hypothetical protein
MSFVETVPFQDKQVNNSGSLAEPTRKDAFEYSLPKAFPTPEEIYAIKTGTACLRVPNPGFVNSILDAWSKYLRKDGNSADVTRMIVEEVRHDAYIGLMCGADLREKKNASRVMTNVVLEISPNITEVKPVMELPPISTIFSKITPNPES